jgi:hypothetical protein
MRLFSYVLLILGFCLLGEAAYQQYHGITTYPEVLVAERLAGIAKDGEITKRKSPEDFRMAMALRWFFGTLTALAGIGLYLNVKKCDRMYPFSPDSEKKEEE